MRQVRPNDKPMLQPSNFQVMITLSWPLLDVVVFVVRLGDIGTARGTLKQYLLRLVGRQQFQLRYRDQVIYFFDLEPTLRETPPIIVVHLVSCPIN
jgi:hypothetical protein